MESEQTKVRGYMHIVRNDWWVTPVWEVQTDFDENFNNALIREIQEYNRVEDPQKIFNYDIWKSSGKHIAELKQKSLEIIKKETHDLVSQNFQEFEYWHTRGWVNYHNPGDYIPIHGHGGAKVAMTYYIHAPKDCGDLVIIDPRGGCDWNSELDMVNGSKYKRVKPCSGKLVFFPAYLLHMVEYNRNQREPRISLTSNLGTYDKSTVDTLLDLIETNRNVQKT